MGTVRELNSRVQPASAVRNAQVLSALRIAVGIFFLVFGEYKVFGTIFIFGGGFQGWIGRFLQGGAYPMMAPVLRNFVLPHSTAIAILVAYGEFAIGLALVLGILVRAASVFGAIYMLALLLSSNYPGEHAVFWQYFGASLSHSILLLCFLAFVFADSCEYAAVRNYLRRRTSAAPE